MNFRFVSLILRIGLFTILVILSGESKAAEAVEAPVPIRIGWQLPTATQAQIVQVLKRTDLLEQHGLEPRLIPFSYGGPQVEAAFAGSLDVFFAGDQPATNLIVRGGNWRIVARLMYDRVAVMVPLDSPIREIEDLRGKTVASPFGSVAHREALLEQEAAGLDTDGDVENKDMDILEIRRRVLASGAQTWGKIDAAVVWEPVVSRFEFEGLARRLTDTRTLGVVAVSDEFIAKHPGATVQLLVALARAWDYFARNPDRVTQWYLDDAQLGYIPETLLSAARLDPNFDAKSLNEVNLGFDAEQIAAIEQGAPGAREVENARSRIRQAIDQSLLAKASEEIAATRFGDIQIILPSAGGAPQLDRDNYSLDAVPLGVIFVTMVLIALLAIESGFWLGRRNKGRLATESVAPIATVVGAVLTMLAFVIALTFGSATNRFDARKNALLDDVNNIQTAYLRANLLPEPHRTTVRSLLRDYVQVRVGMVYAYGQAETLRLVQRRAEALQESIWSHAESLAEADGNPRVFILFTSALNDIIRSHNTRVVLGAHYRIPGFVWWSLVMASCVAMVAVGFQFGIGKGTRILTANAALAITFALVMLIVFDLDRAGEGLIAVNQQPMLDLFQGMSTGK